MFYTIKQIQNNTNAFITNGFARIRGYETSSSRKSIGGNTTESKPNSEIQNIVPKEEKDKQLTKNGHWENRTFKGRYGRLYAKQVWVEDMPENITPTEEIKRINEDNQREIEEVGDIHVQQVAETLKTSIEERRPLEIEFLPNKGSKSYKLSEIKIYEFDKSGKRGQGKWIKAQDWLRTGNKIELGKSYAILPNGARSFLYATATNPSNESTLILAPELPEVNNRSVVGEENETQPDDKNKAKNKPRYSNPETVGTNGEILGSHKNFQQIIREIETTEQSSLNKLLRRRGLNLLVNLDNPNIKIKDHISINSFENAMRYIKNFDEMEQIYKRGSILSFLMRHGYNHKFEDQLGSVMMHRQENDVLRFIFNEIYKNQKEIHDKLSVSDTNDNMQANKFKMKIIKMVFDFNKSKKLTDPNSKNPEKIDWFVSEYDIWEEVDGNLGANGRQLDIDDYSPEQLREVLRKFENLLLNMGINSQDFWQNARSNFHTTREDFKRRLGVTTLTCALNGMNMMELMEKNILVERNGEQVWIESKYLQEDDNIAKDINGKEIQEGAYETFAKKKKVFEDFIAKNEATIDKSIEEWLNKNNTKDNPYFRDYFEKYPEEFNKDGVRPEILKFIRETVKRTSISILISPPIVIPWIDSKTSGRQTMRVKPEGGYLVNENVDAKDLYVSMLKASGLTADKSGTPGMEFGDINYNLKNGGGRVQIGKVLGFIPYMSVNTLIGRTRGGTDSSFSSSISGRDTSLNFTLSPLSIGFGINWKRVSENTLQGMNELSAKFGQSTDLALRQILEGKSFEESSFATSPGLKVVYDKAANEIKNDTKMKEEAKNNEKETESVKEFSSAIDGLLTYVDNKTPFEQTGYNETDRYFYEMFKQMVEAQGGKNSANMKAFKMGALLVYRTQLFQNAEGRGRHLTGFGLGIMFSFMGFAPYISLEFEKNQVGSWQYYETHAKNKTQDRINHKKTNKGEILLNEPDEKAIMKIYGEELKVGRKGQCACVSYDNDAYGKFAPDQINIFVPSFMTRQLAILIAIGISYGGGSGGGNGGDAGSTPSATPGGVGIGGGAGGLML